MFIVFLNYAIIILLLFQGILNAFYADYMQIIPSNVLIVLFAHISLLARTFPFVFMYFQSHQKYHTSELARPAANSEI